MWVLAEVVLTCTHIQYQNFSNIFFFSFDEPVEMLSFPPSIFGSRFWLYLQQHFVILVLTSYDLGLFFYSNPFLIITNTFSLY